MEQTDLLRHTIDALERLTIPYMLVGSFASTAYGEPRFTQDIDIVVDLAQDQVSGLCGAFPGAGVLLQRTGCAGRGADSVSVQLTQWAERLGLSEIWRAVLLRLAAAGE